MATKTATALKKVRDLTEEEILKAPEKDYMNEAQLLFFKKQLLELRDQLLQNADDTGEHLRENEVTTDPSDRATLEEEYTLELRTRDRERKLIRKIDEALKRIEDGSYGYCLETGEEIGIKRLEARPVATLSVEAQERRERREKQYGDRDDRYR
jgi:DnaK suppressor protein